MVKVAGAFDRLDKYLTFETTARITFAIPCGHCDNRLTPPGRLELA